MSESIEAFEVWRKEQIASLVRTGHLEAARAFEQLGSIQGSAWDSAWQASRESLVVELPDDGVEDAREVNPGISDTFDAGYNFATNRFVDVLEGLGLEVAP